MRCRLPGLSNSLRLLTTLSAIFFYAGTLSHQENIALVRLTGLPARRWTLTSHEAPDLSQYQGVVLIDNQGTTSQLFPHVKEAGIPVVLVIDHHAPQARLDAEYVDLRPHIRATATILTQYLQRGLLTLDRSNTKHTKCATALMHGLRADTNQLMHAAEDDFYGGSLPEPVLRWPTAECRTAGLPLKAGDGCY